MKINVFIKSSISCLFAVLLLSFMGCDGNNSATSQANAQVVFHKFIFAVMYENRAWGERQKGLYIDKNGDLYSYINSTTDIEFILGKTEFTDAELTTYLTSSSTFLLHVDSSLLNDKKNLVQSIKNGPFGSLDQICTDAGDFRYYSFDYDAGSNTYKPILIYRTGDFRMTNNNSNDDDLKLWLIDYALQYSIAYELYPGQDNFCPGM